MTTSTNNNAAPLVDAALTPHPDYNTCHTRRNVASMVQAEYHGDMVSFTEDAWLNATEIAEKHGKRVDHWLKTQETTDYIAALCEMSNTPKKGYLKTKRGSNGGTWLHPRLSISFARWIDVKFGIWCDDQIYKILSGKHPHYDWKRSRHETTASYKVTMQILQMTRERLGKTCTPNHFSNEARLINWALTGEFGKVDRDSLSADDLDLLAKLENLDTVLIGCGTSYDDRKIELAQFARKQREFKVPLLDDVAGKDVYALPPKVED